MSYLIHSLSKYSINPILMFRYSNFCSFCIVSLYYSLESWTFEIIVILSGALPNAKLQTSVLSIWLVFLLISEVLSYFMFCIPHHRICYYIFIFLIWNPTFLPFLMINYIPFFVPVLTHLVYFGWYHLELVLLEG